MDPSTAAEILAGQWRTIALEAFGFLDDVATLSIRDRTAGYETAAALLDLVWSSGPRAVSLSWWPYGRETELRLKVGDGPSVSFHSFDTYFSGEPIHQTLRTSGVMREVLPTWAERARPSLLRFFAGNDEEYQAAVAALPASSRRPPKVNYGWTLAMEAYARQDWATAHQQYEQVANEYPDVEMPEELRAQRDTARRHVGKGGP